MCVNAAAGAPVLCVWLEWWRPEALARKAAAYLGRNCLVMLLLGGLLGLALGWMKWTPQYAALWTGPLAYKLHWGAGELLFSLVLAVIYWRLVGGRRTSLGWRLGRGAIALLNGTNLLYHFPPLFAVAGMLAADASLTVSGSIRGAEFRRLAWTGEAPALAIHAVLASIAVAGVMLLGLALRWQRKDESPARVSRVAVWGSRWALGASLAQLPVGLWTLAVLPPAAQSSLMGSDAMATTLFVAALLSVFWLLRDLASVALGETTRPLMIRSMAAMLVVITLMTAMQQAARPAYDLPTTSAARVTGEPVLVRPALGEPQP